MRERLGVVFLMLVDPGETAVSCIQNIEASSPGVSFVGVEWAVKSK